MPVYGTPAGLRDYATARGYTLPAGAVDDATVAEWLLVGSEALDGRYRAAFPGTKVGRREQVREWPRHNAYDVHHDLVPSDSVPFEIENGTYELSIREGRSPGSLSPDFTPSPYKSVSVSGAVAVVYSGASTASEASAQFTIVDLILWPLLTGKGAVSGLSGAGVRV